MDPRPMIQQSLDYIEANLQTEIAATELAEQAGFSLFHYYRLFQQATGFPIMQYILRRRLLHAAYAMAKGRRKTDAALDFGFDTYAGFYKAFCREFGSTPSQFIADSRAKCPYRIDLLKEEHAMISHKTISRILKNWDLEQENITDIFDKSTGSSNDSACYIGNSFVLKYTVDVEKLKKEISLTKALENVGLLSATPVPTVSGEDYLFDGEVYFYLTHRLPGKQMISHKFADGNARFVGEIIGQLHLALSQIDDFVNDADLLSTLQDWALPEAKRILGLSEAFCKEFLHTFSALYPRLPRQIIHRDPNPGNIICSEEQWGFIDYELAERNVRIYDPCYAATAILSESWSENRERWLEIYRELICGYDSVAKLSEDERSVIPYVILTNQFVCVAWFATQEKYAELFEINRKMTLWLIEKFEALKDI